MQSTLTISRKHGGEIKGDRKGSNELNELQRKIQYLGLYRDTLKTMQSAIDKITFIGTGLYVNYIEMIERLYTLLEHRKE